ncbi:MAG: hypothetical protein K2K08_01540, partial [Paramuribaculum sp.]|nr:hypothetical protein [Paramuribaculum sp.]
MLYDWNFEGDGLKVSEVIAGGPFDRASSKVKAGSVVKAVNGVKIDKDTDYTEIFNNLSGKKTLISFSAPGQENWEEVILPISAGALNDLLYNRWVKSREEEVD